jgi:chitodextrinase
MAITISGNLNGGDNLTANANLTYNVYGGMDGYVTPIDTFGSHVTDPDVTVVGDTITLTNVDDSGGDTTFRFSVLDAAGNESALSDPESIISLGDIIAPTAPTLTASNIDVYSVDLDWSGATDNVGVTDYNIYEDGMLIANIVGTSYSVTGLTQNTAYAYTVTALDLVGNESVPSNVENINTLVAADVTAPTPPTLTASNITDTTVDLDWSGATDAVGVTDYNLYQGGVFLINLVGTSYTVTGLTPSTAYAFVVTALDLADNESIDSNTENINTLVAADAEAPTIPFDLQTSGVTDTSLNLTWSASTDNVAVTFYDVYKDDVLLSSVASPSVTLDVTGLTTDTIYKFHVIARDAIGNASDPCIAVNPKTDNNALTYPPQVSVSAYDWGDYVSNTHSADDIDNSIATGTIPFNITAATGSICTLLAPDDVERFQGRYSKHQVFNADDTLIKMNTSNGSIVMPVSGAGDPSTYVPFSVEGGGYWSSRDPFTMYTLFNGEPSLKRQLYPSQPYGSEVLMYDFGTDPGDGRDLYNAGSMSWGMNEGNTDHEDKYVALSGIRQSDGQAVAIIMDLDACKASADTAVCIHSTLEIIDDGANFIDWVSVSPSGDYFVIAYFGDYVKNPITGNAIMVYHNTAGTPTLNTDCSKVNSDGVTIVGCAILQESHADLCLDINGDDVWVGIKHGCSSGGDGQTEVGGCIGYDNYTSLAMTRLRDGRVEFLFSDPPGVGRENFWGGYISGRCTLRQGWAYVTEDCCMGDGVNDTGGEMSSGGISGDLIAIKLDWTGHNLMEVYGRTYVQRAWDYLPAAFSQPSRFIYPSPQGVVCNNGTMLEYESWYSNEAFYDLHPDPGNNGEQDTEQGPAWLMVYPQ